MAKGSHRTWGGWEPRTCWACGVKLTVTKGYLFTCSPFGGTPFSLCGEHMNRYREAWEANAPHLPVPERGTDASP